MRPSREANNDPPSPLLGAEQMAFRGLVTGRTGGAEARDQGLTPREQAVTASLFQVLANKDISETMHLTLETVHGYLRHIYQKLESHGRDGARLGLIGVN